MNGDGEIRYPFIEESNCIHICHPAQNNSYSNKELKLNLNAERRAKKKKKKAGEIFQNSGIDKPNGIRNSHN